MMENFNQPSRVEQEGSPPKNNAVPSINLEKVPEDSSFDEIWKELEDVLARLRFFENNCVWWKTDGHTGIDEQVFLNLIIKDMEKILKHGRQSSRI